MDKSIVVVGAGQAAAEFVRVLRQGGFTSPIRVFGRECFPPYERPPLSKKFLAGDIAPERVFLRNRDVYEKIGVELSTDTTVTSIDTASKQLRLGDGACISFDTCVLATGCDARRPPIPGIDLNGVFVLRTIDDALNLRDVLRTKKRLVIAGGGYLGLEVASSARMAGLDVVLIEGAPSLMQRSISPQASAIIERKHGAEGTRLLLETTLTGIYGETEVEAVTTSHGERIETQSVLVSIGGSPAIELAQACGIRCDNGILVDERCRTSAAHIYAIGDCANQFHPLYGRHVRFEAVNSALFHARSAAADILGKPLPPAKPPTFWSEQCGSMLQIVGVPSPQEAGKDELVGDDKAFAVYRFQNGELVAVEALNRPKDFVRAHALIGRRDVTLPAT
jgi:3-phenylpropionate/trans-cinnamate dioxygenase ferredoxin reductase subunit